jgi:hypothetical protein
MSNVIVDVAGAVLSTLEAAVIATKFSQSFTVSRSYQPDFDHEDLSGIVVYAVPRALEAAISSRMHDEDKVSVDVVVFKKVADRTNATIDPLMTFIQEIHGVLRTSLTSANAAFVSRVSNPIYDVAALLERSLFKSATTFTYRKIHDVRL